MNNNIDNNNTNNNTNNTNTNINNTENNNENGLRNTLTRVKSSPNLRELLNKKESEKTVPFLLSSSKTQDDIDIESKKMMNINYVDLIKRLVAKEPNLLNNQLLLEICNRVMPLFVNEPQLLEIPAPVFICGDIHGQFDDLVQIFKNIGYPSKDNTILFMGDYVDRGSYSIEVITLLFLLKIKYPKYIYLLRGNHECHTINRMYGFYEECQKKANLLIWKAFNQVFSYLPVAAIVEKKIFCVHGGLSPKLGDVRLINQIKKGTKVPDSGLLCDLMWSDPGNHKEMFADNDRGVSCTFNNDVVNKFMGLNNIDLICRAHQVVEGYEFSFGHKLVTIFSAPNYCGEYGNSAAIMKVEKDLTCSFIVLKPVAYIPRAKKASLNVHVN
jgi:serine/threonine-protein phosphatase PP1 catalytic subunit